MIVVLELLIVLAGLAATAILFYHIPVLPAVKGKITHPPTVSVIIPARDEERTLPLLLGDLKKQTLPVFEVICVDDASHDHTASIAQAYGARVVRLNTKPEGWMGKTWACQNGADVAKGELLLFLDADVRLESDGIQTLLQTYLQQECPLSVQPYHTTKRWVEQLSLLFNLVQTGANGMALPKPMVTGLFGPVILLSRQDYQAVGEHRGVCTSVAEDMVLGMRLRKAGLPFRLYVGSQSVSFRMYAGGLRALLQGWTKNMASGAAHIPKRVFALTFVWITSLLSVPLQLVKHAVWQNWGWVTVYAVLYLVWVSVLTILAKKIGRFRWIAIALHPVLTLTLLGVFVVSAVKKVFGFPTIWKGRAVETREKRCD